MFSRFLLVVLCCLLFGRDGFAVAYSEEDLSTGSAVRGVVRWDADYPDPFRFEVNTDAMFCGQGRHIDRQLVNIDAKTKGIEGAVVYLKDIHAGAPLTSVGLGLRGAVHFDACVLTPRVSIMPVGTPLELVTHDEAVHSPEVLLPEGLFTEQLVGVGMRRRVYMREEGLYRVRCHRHCWECAAVFVVEHPYYAVTGPTGEFELPMVPPGAYTLEMWHPTIQPIPISKNGIIVDYDFTNAIVQDLKILVRKDQELSVEFVLPTGGGRHSQ